MKKLLSFLLVLTLLAGAFPLCAPAEVGIAGANDDLQTQGRELIVTGSRVWQVLDQTLLCTELSTGEVLDALPIAPELLQPDLAGWMLFRFNLLAEGEDGVRLCGAFLNGEGYLSVRLLSFRLDGEKGIVAGAALDLTEALGEYYATDAGWLQADLVSCDQGIVLNALDEGFDCHLFLLDPVTGSLSALGRRPYALLAAVLPWEGGLLLAGDSATREAGIGLSLLSLPDGQITDLADFPVDQTVSAQNFVWDPATERLFFTLYNTVYRVAPRGGEAPEPVAVLPALPGWFGMGAVAGGQYLAQGEDGRLLACDTGAVFTAAPVRIASLAECESLGENTAGFNASRTDCYFSLEAVDPDRIAEEGTSLLQAYDAVVLSLSSPALSELVREGWCADLSASTPLSQAVSEMSEPVEKALRREGILAAFPLALETPCLTLNVGALEALSGLSREVLPGDWGGLLAVLADLAAKDSFASHPEYAASMDGVSAEDFRYIMLSFLLRGVLLEASRAPETDAVRTLLPPLLEAFGRIEWQRLGFPGMEELSAGAGTEGKIPLIGEEYCEIGTAYRDEEMVFWPLATKAGGEGIIPQQITVLVLNQASVHGEALLRWAEYLWEHTDILCRMSLCPQMNDPVPNDEYQSTLEELSAMLESYELLAGEITDPEEAEMLRAETEELRSYLEAYRAEARWLVSEESMAAYRSKAFAPDPCAFWDTEEGTEMLESYLTGEISDEGLTDWLESLLPGA